MTLYYQDEHVTLYHGDSLEILPTLAGGYGALLTDPPYFKVKQDEWDNQWHKAADFLAWMGEWLDQAKPLLEPNASVWVFASPAMTSSVERLVGERFRVLNSIRWVKEAGWHQKAELVAMRRYLTPWEGLIFAEQAACYARMGDYLRSERERAGWDRNDLEVALGYSRKANPGRGTELCRRWEEGSSIPTEHAFHAMREVLGKGYMDRPYAEVLADHHEGRRPFSITNRITNTDVWSFPTVKPYPGKHPCEKPTVMLNHMIETSTRSGWTILDPFAGSGSTLEVAAKAHRNAIGIEQDEAYCEQIAQRLQRRIAQPELELAI